MVYCFCLDDSRVLELGTRGINLPPNNVSASIQNPFILYAVNLQFSHSVIKLYQTQSNVVERLDLIGSEIEHIRTKENNCVRVRLR